MNIAYLADAGSLHLNIKAKYFQSDNSSHVTLFAITPVYPAGRRTDKNYHPKFEVVQLQQDEMNFTECFQNSRKIYRRIKKNKIEIIHIIDMANVWYGIILGAMGARVVLEHNGSDVLRQPALEPKIKKWYRLAYHFSSGIVQDSKVAQKRGIELGASRLNNEVIELGIDLDIFHLNIEKGRFRHKYQISDDTKIVFSPRAFNPLYNIGDIIKTIPDVIAKEKHVKYVFCSYAKNPQWLRLIKKLHVEDNVILLGYVDNEKEMPYIYADSDVVVSVPSSDSSPRTVYEAMACGCTVIVSDLPWVHGKLQKEVITVPLRDSKALADTIIETLAGRKFIDKELSYHWVQTHLDYHLCGRRLKNLYNKILTKGKGKKQ